MYNSPRGPSLLASSLLGRKILNTSFLIWSDSLVWVLFNATPLFVFYTRVRTRRISVVPVLKNLNTLFTFKPKQYLLGKELVSYGSVYTAAIL